MNKPRIRLAPRRQFRRKPQPDHPTGRKERRRRWQALLRRSRALYKQTRKYHRDCPFAFLEPMTPGRVYASIIVIDDIDTPVRPSRP